MLELHSALPDVNEQDAAAALAQHWGLRGVLRPLAGERDRNYHVASSGGGEFVLKFSGAHDERALIEFQNAALMHVAASNCAVATPRVVPSKSGAEIVEAEIAGQRHFVRVLSWIPGHVFADWRPHTPGLLHDLGASLGALSKALAGFRHAAAARELKWDFAKAAWITEHVERIRDASRRAMIARIAAEHAERVLPALRLLRRSVTYNDANDHNILVSADAHGDARVCGIIDFGDLVESYTAGDLAIALAYAMMNRPDPLTAATHVVAGYHAAFALEAREIALLLPLARTRLAVSVVNSALQREMAPENVYLQVSDDAAWRLLEQLEREHDRYAEYRFRAACGLAPCPSSAAVTGWIAAHRDEFAPVIDHPLDGAGVHIHDFSAGSTEIGTLDVWHDQRRFSRHVEDVIRDAGAQVGIARYDEVRVIYTTDLMRATGNDGPEWRTVHLGIDVNYPAGSAVYAPTDGVVHSLRDNTVPGDYGPTIILEHRVDGGRLTFWTLYGHLSRESLAPHKVGDRIKAGARVGWIGDRTVNGGWWEHLHFQVICDLFGREGDFGGVSRAGDRETWLSLSPDPSPLLKLPAGARAPRASSVESLRARRTKDVGPSLSVSYRRPLHIVRGAMQLLIDADGRRYLDAVNNVAHVGHAHPDVVRAGHRQMAVLNTNTRYLSDLLLEYSERLTATLPEPLRVCYFVCSGSEANELALRLARAHSKARDVIVLEAGYHGNTSALVDVSPYKFDGPGGAGAPDWVQKVPMPDTYRGAFKRDDRDAGMKYAEAVRDAVARIIKTGRKPAAFLCESVLSCGGQIVLPPGYLAEAYRHVRAAGGVCIADEVQVGFGRVGSHTWGFETQGVVPDIVTMGKPIGNGHPLGAVVTTPEIAASFANGMEYFNTFGGNPVSCAIGLEVLDVIEREGLRDRAHQVGAYLMKGLSGLMGRHPLVGDVRGLGLFVGVELVDDRTQRRPAARQAKYIANRMRDLGVLMSTDGPDNNVLKIKPPMCFSERDADFLVETFDRALGEHPAQPDGVA